MKHISKKILKELNSILDFLRWTSTQFNTSDIYYGHGTDNFWDEAIHLILPSLKMPINTPQKIYSAHLTLSEKKYIIKQVTQRIKTRIPVPYLTNQSWFCNIEFYVDERVFIPRSPLGELIKKSFFNLLPKKPRYILDMCTGSGCIAIAIALNFLNAEIDAVDISKDALKVTEHNIKLHKLENRVIPIQSNLFCEIPKLKYDLILANPPYVNEKEISQLPKEFLFEPKLSLSAGNNELNIIQKILYNADTYLKKNGILICEVGNTQIKIKKKYPHIPFQWINFRDGGQGVFVLTYDQLINNKNYFEK